MHGTDVIILDAWLRHISSFILWILVWLRVGSVCSWAVVP